MLCLTRKPGESIVMHLANGEQITLLCIGKNEQGEVHLGITAPNSVTVRRAEVADTGERRHQPKH